MITFEQPVNTAAKENPARANSACFSDFKYSPPQRSDSLTHKFYLLLAAEVPIF